MEQTDLQYPTSPGLHPQYESPRADDWEDDLRRGLEVISVRADSVQGLGGTTIDFNAHDFY